MSLQRDTAPLTYFQKFYRNHLHARRLAVRRYRFKHRQQILNFYRNKCAICGFDDVRALQLDHINGGGTKENKSISSAGINRRALKHPEEYQLLCANCNWIKRVENKETRRRINEEMN